MSESGITLGIQSALDLALNGSAGSFKVGAGSERQSLEVKYFLTHVGLNFQKHGQDEKLLSELAPVREIFDPQHLDFDEIMQRDIDDARVSSELIPYILDDRTQDLIKFFPPIVVVALPIQADRNKPEAYYPKVKGYVEETNKHGVKNWQITRSGEIGAEVFKFEQPILGERADEHNLVTLWINTTKCRLVIVDGQHRAMALLAIYRNLKEQWNDARRKPFEKYYEEWTPDYIGKFNLSEINLPIIVCTVPTLDTTFKGDYDLKKAARSIFLTLNKNARSVSRTRNILLDDSDLVSSFMRRTLSVIKSADALSSHSLRIHNVELDQDRQKLNSPIAVTGVSHIYYMVEHLLLDSGDISGVSARSGVFRNRTSFSDALDRLKCFDILGDDVCSGTRRDSFTSETEEQLGKRFGTIYGDRIVQTVSSFSPFEAHNYAALQLQKSLSKHNDLDLKSMLFDGQGVVKVFESHRNNLKKKLSDGYFKTDVPTIKAIVADLDATEQRLKSNTAEFYKHRATNYLSTCADKGKLRVAGGEVHPSIVDIVNQFFGSTFTTVAFQSAIVCGFFNEYEKVSKQFQGEAEVELGSAFDEYLSQLNEFFVPSSFSRFKKLVSVLIGRAEGENVEDLKIASQSNDSFRMVVYPGEMQPDQWPKYRYLFMEIWKPSDESLGAQIADELSYCREQVFRSLYERKKKQVAQQARVPEEDLTKEDLESAFQEGVNDYHGFLKHFGRAGEVTQSKLREIIHSLEAATEGDDES